MDKVTAAFLARYRGTIDVAGSSLPGDRAHVVVSAIEQAVATRLAPLLPRVFVVDFHAYRRSVGLPADPTSDVAVSRYTSTFDAAVVARWFATYPMLRELVDGVVAAACAHVVEVVNRFDADRGSLAEVGLVAAGARLVQIEHLDSDPHNGGRTVARLHLDDGTRVIYKPRTLAGEELARRCLGLVSPGVGADLTVCVPESFDRGDYGWQREITSTPATSDQDVWHYFRSFGAMSVLMAALGATDLHHENIVAVRDHPVLVDLETVLSADRRLTADALPEALVARVRRSVANTMLLPQRLPSGPYSVLMGGVGVTDDQRSERTEFVLVDQDTDAVDVARRTFSYRHTSNVLELPDGSRADVLASVDALLDGVRAGAHSLVAVRERLIAEIDERPVRVRQLVRGTANYVRVLAAAAHPDNLADREQFQRVLGLLSPPAGLERRWVRAFVGKVEQASLAVADVPYFGVWSDDTRLCSGQEQSGPAFDLSPRDRAATVIRRFDERDLAFEELMVEEGLAELRRVRLRSDPGYRSDAPGMFGDCLGPDGVVWREVVERLDTLAVEVEGIDGRERGWVTGAYGDDMATYDPGTAVSLHDSGGLVVLARRLVSSARHPEERARRMDDLAAVRRGSRALRRHNRESLDAMPFSVVSGQLSLEYAWDDGSDRLPGAELHLARCWATGAEAHGDDLLLGAPGAGLLLAAYPGTPEGVVERLLSATAERALSKKHSWDLAHGDVGLAWARARMFARLDRSTDATAEARRIAEAAVSLPPGAPSGWCAGAAGLLMVGAELVAASRADVPLRALAERAVTLPEPGRPVDLSVCHGAAGVVQALVRTAGLVGEQWPLDMAADYWARGSKHGRDEGFCTGEPSRQSLLGYFLGWAGIADTGLLLAQALDGTLTDVPLGFVPRCGVEGAS